MVNGIKSSREIKEGENYNRPCSSMDKIILYIEEGTFSGVMFSTSTLANQSSVQRCQGWFEVGQLLLCKESLR